MLKVKDINVYYGKIHALKNVSFEVRPGEVVALIGANGAGKSTTLKTVSGMMHSRTGSIEFLGEDITHTPSHNLVYKGLAHVPEGRRIFQQMTVLENLEMGGFTRPDKEIPGSIEQMFELFPRLKERQKQIGGDALRRRAADAGYGPGADQPPQAADAGRALHGPCPHSGGTDLRYHPGAAPVRHHHPAGGTERRNGLAGGGPGLCAGIRKDRTLRHRP